MGNISEHFNREEFACGCKCGFATADKELIEVLEDVRQEFNSPITISSGSRCISHNHSVGGRPNSKHLQGIAADIVVKGFSPDLIHAYLYTKYMDKYGLGKYGSFTHIDVRPDKARWNG